MIFIKCLIQQRVHIFLGPHCVACRNNLLTLQKPHQLQLQLNFNFPNSVPTCPGNISVFLFGCLSLLSPPYSSFLHLKSVRSSPFSHAGLLLYLLSILNIRMDCSAALRRLSLKIKQLSWVSLPSRADSQEILLTSSLNKPKSTCLKFQVIIILLAFLTSLRFLTSHLMTLQPSIPKTVLPYSGEAGPASTGQHRSSTSTKMLSLHTSPKLLIPITLPLPADMGSLTFSWKSLAYDQKNIPISWWPAWVNSRIFLLGLYRPNCLSSGARCRITVGIQTM